MTDFRFADYSAPAGNNINFNLHTPVQDYPGNDLAHAFGSGIRGDRVNFVFTDGFQTLSLRYVKSTVVLCEIGSPPIELQMDFGGWYFINIMLHK